MFASNLFNNPFPNPYGMRTNPQVPKQPEIAKAPDKMVEDSLPRVLNYWADSSGCCHWRVAWPEQILNAYQKIISHSFTMMVLDPRFYGPIKAVRIQRQATETQLQFVKFLKDISKQNGMKLIYEVDDIIFHEDIPEYNKFKPAFTDPKIRQCAAEIIELCDEMTVTCDFMRDYYASKTNNKKVTVIPNYIPRFWMDRYYDPKKIEKNYDKNRNKPRILYAGSGAHFDVDNRTKQKDDFYHVLQQIALTCNDFQWVFLGAYPCSFAPLVRSGKIEFHPWANLYDYPQKIADLNVNLTVAPLTDNIFNRSKSDIKYVEACAFGLPSVLQNMCTYKEAPFKFNTGDEMIDQIKLILKDKNRYMNISKNARKHAETRWLESENNIGKYVEMYLTPYGDQSRKFLKECNKF